MTSGDATPSKKTTGNQQWQTLIEFTLSCQSGSAGLATDLVVGAVHTLNWPAAHLEQLRRAVSTAIFNGLGRGTMNDSGAMLVVRVFVAARGKARQKDGSTGGKAVRRHLPGNASQPVNRSSSGGWGFFLVQRQENAPPVLTAGPQQLIELFLYEEGEQTRKSKRL